MAKTTQYSLIQREENAHEDPIFCCAWAKENASEDNKNTKNFIVTGGLDSQIKVWMFENNKLDLLKTLIGHSLAVESVAVSPDGFTLVSTSLDGSLFVWDLISGNKVYEAETNATDVWKVVFSPDGLKFATGGHTGKVIICSLETGKQERILDTRGKCLLSVAWSSSGQLISSGADDGTMCIFDVAQGKLLHVIEAHTKPVRSVAFSPNSAYIITACDDGFVKIYSVAGGTLQGEYKQENGAFCSRFSPDGSRVAVAYGDGTVRVLAADDLSTLHTFQEHSDMVCDLHFDADGTKLVSVSKDKSINIYKCPKPQKDRK